MIGCLIAVVVLFYAEENWRGKHAWEKYQREREAKGDKFEWSAIVPPPVPDDQNFAATPLFAELFPKPPEHPRLDAVKLPYCPDAGGDWLVGRVENLAAWRACFTNDDLLAALKQYEPILREVEEASRRPSCRFPIRYEDNFDVRLPHLSRLRNLARTYRLRALAELSTGQMDAASDDVQMGLRFIDLVKNEPLILSRLVRGAILGITVQPVWEGLAAHQWNENQLAALQANFEKIDLFDGFVKAMQGERILYHSSVRWMIERPLKRGQSLAGILGMEKSQPRLEALLISAAPTGWFYQNMLRTDRFFTETFPRTVDWEHQRFIPATVKATSRTVETTRTNSYNILSQLFIPPLNSASWKIALSQAIVQQVTVACALERYRLAHGRLPDTLDALVPALLMSVPHDVIDGQPLRYHHTAADQFVLYSIGWNERDDGGQIALRKGEPRQPDCEAGDWVWFSQPQPSASERK